ncbi:MAG TPA: hypothetical protein PLR06_05080 [Cyclobacteriaceae bacterium]|nr:hypothetical protein [Cyclobacteriaceae bacterium]
MKPDEIENLFLLSLDTNLDDSRKQEMVKSMREQAGLAEDLEKYTRIREKLKRNTPATFGPYFAQKVINHIQNLRVEIDQQIVFFFRKYQLAALGIVIALVAVNVIFADSLNLPSVLGIEETVTTADDDLLTFDFYENITNN